MISPCLFRDLDCVVGNPVRGMPDLPSSAISLAVTGSGLVAVREHAPAHLRKVIKHAKVFARTKPHDKKYIVSALMHGTAPGSGEEVFPVLFCGDGANDMAALRAATVGVR